MDNIHTTTNSAIGGVSSGQFTVTSANTTYLDNTGYYPGYYPSIPSYYPGTVTIGPPLEMEKDELKSKPVLSEKDEHQITSRLCVMADSVVIEYFCSHCTIVLYSKVISKLPKSISKKCLPKILKGVK